MKADLVLGRPFVAFSLFEGAVTEVLRHVVDHLLAWRQPRHRVVITEVAPARLRIPAQQCNPRTPRVLLWEPVRRAGSSAFVGNLDDGWSSLVHMVCAKASLTCYEVRMSQPSVESPIVELAWHEGGSMRRFVRAMRDSPKWQFFQQGAPWPFEAIEDYRKRRIADRFPRQLLFRYLDLLGWPVRDPDFWRTTHAAWSIACTPPGMPAGRKRRTR